MKRHPILENKTLFKLREAVGGKGVIGIIERLGGRTIYIPKLRTLNATIIEQWLFDEAKHLPTTSITFEKVAKKRMMSTETAKRIVENWKKHGYEEKFWGLFGELMYEEQSQGKREFFDQREYPKVDSDFRV